MSKFSLLQKLAIPVEALLLLMSLKTTLKKVKALYKEIRRLSDSLLPQERVMDCLRKEKQDLTKENQNLRDSMTDIILKLPNFCKVSYTKRDDGKVVLDLKPFD